MGVDWRMTVMHCCIYLIGALMLVDALLFVVAASHDRTRSRWSVMLSVIASCVFGLIPPALGLYLLWNL